VSVWNWVALLPPFQFVGAESFVASKIIKSNKAVAPAFATNLVAPPY
jgi:hypothetical protein